MIDLCRFQLLIKFEHPRDGVSTHRIPILQPREASPLVQLVTALGMRKTQVKGDPHFDEELMTLM